jgi:hypothetical protein
MAGRVIPDLRTSYRFHANGEVKINGTIEADMTMNANLNVIEDHDIKFVNGGNISNVSLVNGIDLSDWKSDYDAKIDQNVQLDSSPQFGDLKVATVVCPNYPAGGTGLFNTVDIKAFKADYDLKVNQDVRTSAAPTFTGMTLGTVHYPSAPVATGYVLTQGEDGSLHLEEPNTTLPGRITLASGTANEPAYSWSLDDDAGMFYDSGTAFSHGGVKRMWVDGSGLTVDDDVTTTSQFLSNVGSAAAPTYTWTGHVDTGMYYDNGPSWARGGTKKMWLDNTGFNVDDDAKVTGTTTTNALTVGTAPFSTPGSAPVFGCRAFATFDGQAVSDVTLTGNYTRAGNVVNFNILSGTDPDWIVGNRVYINFTSGAATDGEFTITAKTPGSPNIYQITHGSSGTITSNTHEIRVRAVSNSGNVNSVVSNLSTGYHLVNFSVAVPTNFSISGMCEAGLVRLDTGVGLESDKFVRVLAVNTGGTAINSATVSVNVIA